MEQGRRPLKPEELAQGKGGDAVTFTDGSQVAQWTLPQGKLLVTRAAADQAWSVVELKGKFRSC